MLLELRVENYAVIDQAVVAFGPGLNLLTGETGAGKSILIDALALLLGEKASASVVRHGAEKAVVTCVFEMPNERAAGILGENGIDAAEDDAIIVRREIFANGKGRVYVNNQPATVAVLRQLGGELASIHAQNETLDAFDARSQLYLLDRYAGLSTEAVARCYGAWRALEDRIREMERDEQDRLRMLDLWNFQHREIAGARLQAGEDAQLEGERRVLANAEKLYTAAMAAHEVLYESAQSAETALRAGLKQIEELARYDERFEEQAQTLASARAMVEDAAACARDFAEGIDASPERLAEVEDRLALLDRLKRKYGHTLDEVIAFGDDLTRKLNEIENRDQILADLRREVQGAAERFLQEARELSKRRAAAARKLEKIVEGQINDLAMKARFHIEVAPATDAAHWSATGIDAVSWQVATNAGEPLKPIEEVASGGEMSRIMLALKTSVEEGAGKGRPGVPRTLVFDEIDTGIGGRAAEAVGTKLKALSKAHQVLCITHLPQIASFGDQHYLIEKTESKGRTKTGVRLLDREQRTEEIARMLSGATLTDTSIRHAEQMLKANA